MNYLVNDSNDTHFNMAFDEYALERLGADAPVFFLWQNRPSVIIGLNQSAYAEVNLKYLEEKGITLARRVTGGGAVYHDLQNLNYTITGRSRDLEKDYPGYLAIVVGALRELGVPAEVSGRNDILVEGRKCSGFAKRVAGDRLMVHGTLMYDVDLGEMTRALAVPGSKLSAAGIESVRSRGANLKEYLPGLGSVKEFQAALQAKMAGGDGEIVLSPGQLAEIRKDADEKFRTWEWNYGRSPVSDFMVRRKFACGTVEAHFSIKHGRLSGLRFGGDFMGNLPSEGIEAALEGCRFEAGAISAALQGIATEQYFDKLTAAELCAFLIDTQ